MILVNTCGFLMLDSDPTLFIKWFGPLFILLIVWVDDIVAAYHAKLAEEFTAFFNLYNETYTAKLLGPTEIFSGIQVERDRQNRTVKLHG